VKLDAPGAFTKISASAFRSSAINDDRHAIAAVIDE
jgi:hypothetical protein